MLCWVRHIPPWCRRETVQTVHWGPTLSTCKLHWQPPARPARPTDQTFLQHWVEGGGTGGGGLARHSPPANWYSCDANLTFYMIYCPPLSGRNCPVYQTQVCNFAMCRLDYEIWAHWSYMEDTTGRKSSKIKETRGNFYFLAFFANSFFGCNEIQLMKLHVAIFSGELKWRNPSRNEDYITL